MARAIDLFRKVARAIIRFVLSVHVFLVPYRGKTFRVADDCFIYFIVKQENWDCSKFILFIQTSCKIGQHIQFPRIVNCDGKQMFLF